MLSADTKYKAIFDVTPVPIWEEDFSEVKAYLTELNLMGKPEGEVKSILQNSPEIIDECSKRIKIIDFNEACIKLHNASDKDQLVVNFQKLFLPETRAAIMEEILCIVQGKTNLEMESKMQTIDGKEKHIFMRWKVLPGSEESLDEVLVTTEDITAAKEIFQNQLEIESKLTEAQKIAKVGYFEYEPITKEIFWSKEVYRIWELEKDSFELTPESLLKTIHPERGSALL